MKPESPALQADSSPSESPDKLTQAHCRPIHITSIDILSAKASWIPIQHQEFREYILPSMRGRGLWMLPTEQSPGHSLPWSPLSQKLEWEYLLVKVILATVSPVAQQWRIHQQCMRHRRCAFDPWVRKILWRREWQPTPAFLPGESHTQRSLVGYSP